MLPLIWWLKPTRRRTCLKGGGQDARPSLESCTVFVRSLKLWNAFELAHAPQMEGLLWWFVRNLQWPPEIYEGLLLEMGHCFLFICLFMDCGYASFILIICEFHCLDQVKLHWLTNWHYALDCRMKFKAPCCEFSESGLLCFNVISILLSAFQGFTGRHMRTQLFVQNLLKVRRVRVFPFVQETHISCSWIERKDCYETARVEALHLCPIDHGGLQLQATIDVLCW